MTALLNETDTKSLEPRRYMPLSQRSNVPII